MLQTTKAKNVYSLLFIYGFPSENRSLSDDKIAATTKTKKTLK